MSKMEVVIRKWKDSDIPALVELTMQWGFETTVEKITRHLHDIENAANAEVFIAEVAGKVVGRIFVREHLSLGNDAFAEVHDLVVDSAFRRRNIGAMLIAKVKEWSIQNGFTTLRLRTNVKRKEANLFYPKVGFTLEKTQNVYTLSL